MGVVREFNGMDRVSTTALKRFLVSIYQKDLQSIMDTYIGKYRWLKWIIGHKLNPLQPTGSILSRFLADLYIVDGLAYTRSTILLHKSVVSTLCSCDNDKLSSHVLVRHILKAIVLKKPVPKKPAVWNIDKLILFSSSYSVDENSIFATCRHTATLLLSTLLGPQSV